MERGIDGTGEMLLNVLLELLHMHSDLDGDTSTPA